MPLLGRFIADFCAPSQRLVIEVDGAYHAERGRTDARREVSLERAGYRVVRLEAASRKEQLKRTPVDSKGCSLR